jgi:hypothetical protein
VNFMYDVDIRMRLGPERSRPIDKHCVQRLRKASASWCLRGVFAGYPIHFPDRSGKVSASDDVQKKIDRPMRASRLGLIPENVSMPFHRTRNHAPLTGLAHPLGSKSWSSRMNLVSLMAERDCERQCGTRSRRLPGRDWSLSVSGTSSQPPPLNMARCNNLRHYHQFLLPLQSFQKIIQKINSQIQLHTSNILNVNNDFQRKN